MSQHILHVVFSPSGAGSLREALHDARRDDRVVALFDSKSFGPINSCDPATRAKWVEDNLGYDWYEIAAGAELFWQDAIASAHRKIVWVTRRSVNEYCGYLEWLWRTKGGPCEVVDLTRITVTRRSLEGPPAPPHPVPDIGIINREQFCEGQFWDTAHNQSADELARDISCWKQLRKENAPLRVIENGALVSAPLSYFDPGLLVLLTGEWQKTAFVIGQALVMQMEKAIHQTGDLVLAARIRSLARAGILAMRGDFDDLHASEIRLV